MKTANCTLVTLWRTLLKTIKWLAVSLLTLITLFVLFYVFQAIKRPARLPLELQLSDSVTYSRHIRDEPQRAVMHLVAFDLTTKGLEFFTTPPDRVSDSDHLKARTTTQFAEEFEADLAVNASFFFPIDYSLSEFYPQVGDWVSSVGLTISDGVTFSPEDDIGFHTLCILPKQILIQFENCPSETVEAVSGNPIFLWDGELSSEGIAANIRSYSRSAVAVDETGRKVWLLVVDGQQPGYSLGLTFTEMADFLAEQGATAAINLDGGGSVTLVKDGKLLNSPAQNLIPMRQRPIANHLGLRLPDTGK